jgi:DNA-binding response OmpR family regulator
LCWPLRPFLAPDREEASARPAARILVVEDDYFVSTYIEAVLGDAGFTLIGTVHAGEEAVQLAVDGKPDLVIMDIRLAGAMDGIDAAREILSLIGVRSLFVTAHSDEVTRARGAIAHPVGWLEKPFNGFDLLRTVRQALKDGGG